MASVFQSTFPDENVDPKKKESKEWLWQYSKAALSSYMDGPMGGIGWRSRDSYERNKTYALGKQAIDKYKKMLIRGEDPSNNALVVDWSVLPIIPKFRRIALGMLDKVDYKIQINPIDPLAKDEVEDDINNMRFKVMARQAAQKYGMPEMADNPLIASEPGEPEDLDGVAVMELGTRHRTAMEMEQLVELTLNANKYIDMRRQLNEDRFDYGCAFTKDDTDGTKISVRRCDPRRMVMSFCTYPDFSDLRYIGEIVEMPVSQLIAASNGQITKEQIEQLWRMGNANSWGISGIGPYPFYNTWSEFWNKGKVAVFDLEIRSTDTVTYEERVNRRENLVFGKAEFASVNVRKEKFKTRQIQNIYRIKTVLNTDICYDYGKKTYMKRNPSNIACTEFSYHVSACSFFDMRVISRMEQLIPIADNIQLASYKLQHALNTTPPKGFIINLDALEDVCMSASGTKMSPSDILDFYFQRGIIVARSSTIDGKDKGLDRVIEELKGGVGNEIVEFQNTINQNIDLIRSILGLNELTDGSTPNPKMLTTIANLAATGTNNALSDLFEEDRKMTRSLASAIVVRSQDIVRDGNDELLVSSLGTGTVKILRSIKDIHKYRYSVLIEDLPSVDELQAFNKQVEIAQQTGQINIDDVLMLESIQNMKQQQMFLAYRVRKNREIKQRESMELQQQNAQVQQQSAMVAEQAKQQTIQLQYDLELRNKMEEKRMEAELLKLRGDYDLERERIASTGRVESSYIQATERQSSNIRTNATKLIDNDKGEQVEKIDVVTNLRSTVEPQTANNQPLQVNADFSFMPPEPVVGQESVL